MGITLCYIYVVAGRVGRAREPTRVPEETSVSLLTQTEDHAIISEQSPLFGRNYSGLPRGLVHPVLPELYEFQQRVHDYARSHRGGI